MKNRKFVNMNSATIRDRLYDYNRVADDKKIKAIYMILKDDIAEESEFDLIKNLKFVLCHL
jgi:hypothetical protein